MQTLNIVLLVLSSALSLALVGFGLSLIERCVGVIPLEVIPLGIAFAFEVLSLWATSSPSTLSASDLLPFSLCCLVLLFVLHPVYVNWRLRLGGESRALMFSFTLMSCWIQLMQIRTASRAIGLKLPETLRADQSRDLKCVACFMALTLLLSAGSFVNRRGRLAALQLSRGDSRLLTTLGLSSISCQRLALGMAILLITFGASLYICLQDSFSFPNSYDIVIPAFAISLSQIRIRVLNTVVVSIFLLAGIECLTELSTEPTVRESHQSVMYGLVVLLALSYRLARKSGWFGIVERKWHEIVPLMEQVRNG